MKRIVFVTPTNPQPHSMNKFEDYGLKAVTLAGEGSLYLLLFFYLILIVLHLNTH